MDQKKKKFDTKNVFNCKDFEGFIHLFISNRLSEKEKSLTWLNKRSKKITKITTMKKFTYVSNVG